MKDDSLRRDWTWGVGPGSPMTFEEWKRAINTLRHYANCMGGLVNELARRISKDAGLDPTLLGFHPHNAWSAHESGQPWANVDYNRVRVVLDLLEHEFDASRMVDAFDKAVRIDPHQRYNEASSKVDTPE